MLESITSLRQVKPLAYILTALTATIFFFLMTSQAFAAAPTMTATTLDANGNGTVDRVVITFSEASDVIDGNAGDGLTSLVLNSGCTIPNLDYALNNQTTLTISNLTGCTSASTSITPTINYTSVLDCTTAGAICDDALANQMVTAGITASDNAQPVMLSAVLSSTAGVSSLVAVNRVTFSYSENMTINPTSGASTTTLGDLTTAGTFVNLGTFAVGGTVTVGTAKNTLSGNGTSAIVVDLADQAGGFITSAANPGTEPSGVVTPIAHANIVAAAGTNTSVNVTNTPTATGTGTWDITKPTLTSITLNDGTGNNGKVDRASLLFNSNMRDSSFSDAEATLTGTGSLARAGTFTTGSANDTATSFNTTADTLAVDTAAGAADFTYVASTRNITDLAGNKVDLATDGSIATADAVEVDGASPIVTAAVMSSTAGTVSLVAVNRMTFTYSEVMTVTDGASSTTKGNMTVAGTVAGFGGFGTTGDMTVPTTKNTVGGNGTANIYIEFADQAAGYMTTASNPGTAVGGTFTPVASAVLTDAVTLQVNTNATVATSGSGWDLTRPTITSATIADVNGSVQNGKVDRVTLVLNSAMRDSNATAGDFLLGGATHTGTLTTGTANDATTQFNLTTDSLAVDTSTTTGQLTYTGLTTNMTDLAGNLINTTTPGTIVNADIAETDGAAPVLVTISPVSGATGISRTATITMTFSEIIASLTYTPVGQATSDYTTSLAAAAVTLTPKGSMSSGYHSIDILTAPDAATNAFGGIANGAASNIVDPFNFTTISASSSGTTGTTGTTNTVTVLVTSPNGGESLTAGSTHTIAWSATSTNGIGAMNLSYTTDGGLTYNTIANNVSDTGTYNWTVPDIDAAQVFVKVAATDLVDTLASDSSDSEFAIVATVSTPADEVTAPSTGTTGLSPLTGEEEDISVVAYGDYIKGTGYDTVYFVAWADDGVTLMRRPFNDSQTFFTYESDFSELSTVTDATLPTLALGAPMMPKSGVVLVKIQSVAKVYAIGDDGELRWVTSEALASSIYGAYWADYVIDIPDTLYPNFEHGTDITTDENIDTSGMKTRAVVNM